MTYQIKEFSSFFFLNEWKVSKCKLERSFQLRQLEEAECDDFFCDEELLEAGIAAIKMALKRGILARCLLVVSDGHWLRRALVAWYTTRHLKGRLQMEADLQSVQVIGGSNTTWAKEKGFLYCSTIVLHLVCGSTLLPSLIREYCSQEENLVIQVL